MATIKRYLIAVGQRVPNNLSIFVSAIFLSLGVTSFISVYGASTWPERSAALLTSCGASMVAAAMWTIFASKVEQIERAALSAAQEMAARDAVRMKLWDVVWLRISVYLGSAIVFSVLALAVLLIPYR